MSPCFISVASSGPVPYFKRFWPGCRFRSATKAATSPSMTVAFQVACRSVVDATNFGIWFIRSTNPRGAPGGDCSTIFG